MTARPLIAVNSYFERDDEGVERLSLRLTYAEAIVRAGGTPLAIAKASSIELGLSSLPGGCV